MYKKLIISLAAALCSINVVLVLSGVKRVDLYFLVNAAVYFMITLLYTYPNHEVRRRLNYISAIVFTGFLVLVAINVIELLK